MSQIRVLLGIRIISFFFCAKKSRKPQKDRGLLRDSKDRPQKCNDFFIDRKDHAYFVDKALDRKMEVITLNKSLKIIYLGSFNILSQEANSLIKLFFDASQI